jgi:hypothetical protein
VLSSAVRRHLVLIFILCGSLLAGCAGVSTRFGADSRLTATDLPLSEVYGLPVGPKGLAPTPKLLSLNGKRVRLRGYMVHEEEPFAGRFLLAPVAVSMAERADGPADDLPPATVFVHLPEFASQKLVKFSHEAISVEGRLDLGAKQETDDRISYLRLQMDDLRVATARVPGGRSE